MLAAYHTSSISDTSFCVGLGCILLSETLSTGGTHSLHHGSSSRIDSLVQASPRCVERFNSRFLLWESFGEQMELCDTETVPARFGFPGKWRFTITKNINKCWFPGMFPVNEHGDFATSPVIAGDIFVRHVSTRPCPAGWWRIHRADPHVSQVGKPCWKNTSRGAHGVTMSCGCSMPCIGRCQMELMHLRM